jgi:hypothetical protein
MPGFEPVRPSTSDWALAPYRDELVRRAGHPRGVVAGFEFLTRFVSSPDVQSLHHVVLGRYTYSTRPYPAPHDVTVLIGDMSNPYLQDCVDPGSGARMRDLIARNRLVPVAAAGDNLLFLRDSPDSIELVSFPGRMPEAARRVVYDGSVAYRGWDPPAEVTPGGLLSIRTYWERLGPTRAVYNTEIVVSDSSDSARIDRSRMIGYLFAPVADWPMHTMLRETYRLPIPPDLAPGDYEFGLRVGQQSGDTEWAARPDDPDVIDNDSTLVLGRIRVRSPGARQTGRP